MNVSKLKSIIAENGYSQRKVAKALGLAEKTFYLKMKKGVFTTEEVVSMIKLLKIENPAEIFLQEGQLGKVTNGRGKMDTYEIPNEIRETLIPLSEAEWSRFVLRALLNYHERITLNEAYPGLDCWKQGLQFAINCVEEKITK